MSDAISFLLILPALVLGVAVLDSAGTLGKAEYRTSTYAEAASALAADTLARSPGSTSDPSARTRWDEVSATVEQSGLAATAGVCNQADDAFDVDIVAQPQAQGVLGATPSVAVMVSCPVELSRLLTTNRVVAVSVESVR